MNWSTFNNIHFIFFGISILSIIIIILNYFFHFNDMNKSLNRAVRISYLWIICLLLLQVIFNGCIWVNLENTLFNMNQHNTFLGIDDKYNVQARLATFIFVIFLIKCSPSPKID